MTHLKSAAEVSQMNGWEYTKSSIKIAYKYVHNNSDLPTLLFLHGGPGENSAYLMEAFGKEIEASYNVIWMDQRGCGNSPRDLGPLDFTISAHVHDIHNVLKATNTKKAVIIAHSFGALIGGLFSSLYKENVSAYINVCGLGSFLDFQDRLLSNLECAFSDNHEKLAKIEATRNLKNDFFKLIAGFRLAREAKLYYKDYEKTKSEIKQFINQCTAKGEYSTESVLESEESLFNLCKYDSLASFEIYNALEDIEAPTLCIAGLFDKVNDVECVKKYAGLIKNSSFKIFQESGHHPFQEEKENFLNLLREFLQQHNLMNGINS